MNWRWLANSKAPMALAVRAGLIVVLLAGGFWFLHSREPQSSSQIQRFSAVPNGGLQVDAVDLDFGEHWENETDEGGPVRRTIRLLNPTRQDVVVEKFQYPCAVGGVAERQPVKVPAHGETNIEVVMCPKRLMTFNPNQLSVVQRLRIQPLISGRTSGMGDSESHPRGSSRSL